MIKKIGIIGSGGHAKIIVDIIKSINNTKETFKIIGIFDDNKLGSLDDIPILDKINNLTNYECDVFVIALGNCTLRKIIAEEYNFLKWEILIHPTAIISNNSIIGEGTVVCAGSIIQTYANIGQHCIINTGSSIDHDSIINNFTNISPKATLCGNVSIGSVTLIGANATIIQNIKIGNNCVIGAGSVIIRDVDDFSKVVGNPGKLI